MQCGIWHDCMGPVAMRQRASPLIATEFYKGRSGSGWQSRVLRIRRSGKHHSRGASAIRLRSKHRRELQAPCGAGGYKHCHRAMKLKVTAAEQCQWIMNKQSIDIFTENVRQCQWIIDKKTWILICIRF